LGWKEKASRACYACPTKQKDKDKKKEETATFANNQQFFVLVAIVVVFSSSFGILSLYVHTQFF